VGTTTPKVVNVLVVDDVVAMGRRRRRKTIGENIQWFHTVKTNLLLENK